VEHTTTIVVDNCDDMVPLNYKIITALF